MTGTSRPIDSGRKDAAGRTIRVSGNDTATRADAPPPPLNASETDEVAAILDEIEAQEHGDAPASRYGVRSSSWMPVARAYAEKLIDGGFDDPAAAFDAAISAVVNDSVEVANELRGHELWERDWGGDPLLPSGWSNDDADAAFGDYLEAAAWSSTDTDEDGDPVELRGYEFSDSAKEELRDDFDDFIAANHQLITESGLEPGQVAHDFWLTRCGHGAGFWDRGLGEVGDKLSEAAKVYGNVDLWLNDDEIEVS